MTAEASRPRIVGLLGGIASGKSLVARQFEELGAGLLDADAAGHEVLQLPNVRATLQARWGDGVFGADGHLIRSAIARVVFAPTEAGRRELAFLESVTHPLIGERLREHAQQLAAPGRKLLVLDAPVLLEAGWESLCDKLVFVDAPEEVRLARALTRGWTAYEFATREAAQKPLEFKRKRADFVVENGTSPEVTKAQVAQLWQKLTGTIE